MLEGRKSLVVFHDAYPAEWLSETLERFEPFVRSGRLVRRMIDTPFTKAERARFLNFQGWRRVFFSLPAEEWRIDAFLLLSKVSAKTGWNEALERMEGSLLWLRRLAERLVDRARSATARGCEHSSGKRIAPLDYLTRRRESAPSGLPISPTWAHLGGDRQFRPWRHSLNAGDWRK